MNKRVVNTWTCPRKCGYFRRYTTVPAEWGEQIIAHPIYGPVRNAIIVSADIETHDCYEYRAAMARLRRAHGPVENDQRVS